MQKLESYGIECAEDAHEDENIDEETLKIMGLEYVCEQVQIGDITFDDLERILERTITEEERKIMEWRF